MGDFGTSSRRLTSLESSSNLLNRKEVERNNEIASTAASAVSGDGGARVTLNRVSGHIELRRA